MTFKAGDPAPIGSNLNCKNWLSEAALRMLLNNLDREVAENPDKLVVYGGRGQAARSFEDLQQIIEALQDLELDESLLVQSGAAIARIKTHKDAPKVLIANSNLVGAWANWETFDALAKKGLMMYGQMTAGSWIYIGSQGIVQGTYETFFEAFNQHYEGKPKGHLVFSSGLGGMGGAQPLAATLCGACFLGIEVDRTRAEMRLHTKYLDQITDSTEEALNIIADWQKNGIAKSLGLVGNAAEILPELIKDARFKPSLVTDQTSAHDPLYGYVPIGYSMEKVKKMRIENPEQVRKDSKTSIAIHVKSMLELHHRGIPTFDYGNNIRAVAFEQGVKDAYDFKGFVPLYIRPLFEEGKGPFRFVCLSGDMEDLKVADQALKAAFPEEENVQRWLKLAPERIQSQGLPSRILWLGYLQRCEAGQILNKLVKTGKIKCPVVIGRDHLDCGSVASPNRETEGMLDGTDAVADWPLLNAFGNIASGATWVSFHHGGGVGMGYSLHSGIVVVADGSDDAAIRLRRVLSFDPAMGVFRHADAGYEKSQKIAAKEMANDKVTEERPRYYPRKTVPISI